MSVRKAAIRLMLRDKSKRNTAVAEWSRKYRVPRSPVKRDESRHDAAITRFVRESGALLDVSRSPVASVSIDEVWRMWVAHRTRVSTN